MELEDFVDWPFFNISSSGFHLGVTVSEADRTQLPFLQAFILSTKSRISYILPWSGMDPIFISEGALFSLRRSYFI